MSGFVYSGNIVIESLRRHVAALTATSMRQSEMLALVLKEKNDLLQEKLDLDAKLKFTEQALEFTEQALEAACLDRLMPSEPTLPKPKFRINQFIMSLGQEGKDYMISQVLDSRWNCQEKSWEYRTTTSRDFYISEQYYRTLGSGEI